MAELSGNGENEPLRVAESVNTDNKMPPGSRKWYVTKTRVLQTFETLILIPLKNSCDCKQIGKFVVLSMFWFGASFANFILPTVIVPSQVWREFFFFSHSFGNYDDFILVVYSSKQPDTLIYV